MYQIARPNSQTMSYQTRLRNYEMEKRELMEKPMTAREYEQRIAEIARKWRV